MSETTMRVCLIFKPTYSSVEDSICLDLPFVPKIGEKIDIDTYRNERYNIKLQVFDRKYVVDDTYPHWEVYCSQLD